MLSERSQAQEDQYVTFSPISRIQKVDRTEVESRIVDTRALEDVGKGGMKKGWFTVTEV